VASKKLDAIDAKLIKDLLKDARKNFAEIAKECGVSNTTISDHFRELEKTGIIKGATVHMDYKRFGYNAVGNLFIKVDPEQADNVVKFIKKMPNIYGVYQGHIKYFVGVVATLKTLSELDHLKDAIRRQSGVIDFRTSLWTDIKNIPENLAVILIKSDKAQNKTAKEPTEEYHPKKEIKIDKIDRKITEKLAIDGLMPFTKIAQELGVSTDTVVRRYRKLKENGVIKTLIQIDPTKIGYFASVSINIAFSSQNNSSTIVETLAEIPDMTLIMKTSGDYDIHTAALVRDVEQVLALQEKIAQIQGITKIETSVGRVPFLWPGPRQYISTF
jgi:DNA-binding Lrp family transcriptional regulator